MAVELDYFALVVGFIVAQHVFETYVNLRQHKRFKIAARPKRVETLITEEQFQKSQSYNLDKSSFSFIKDNINLVASLIELFYYSQLWDIASTHIEFFGLDDSYILTKSVYFYFMLYFIGLLISVPTAVYSNFVIEEKHGFNKSTALLFITDQLKSTLVVLVIGVPVLYALIVIIEWGGEHFWAYVCVFLIVLQLVMVPVFQQFIAPLFNKFTPLEEGEIRERVWSLSNKIGFPLKEVFVVDGSKRSNHSNAYFYGLFKSRRIVIFDTLINQATVDEVEAIVAHELGHYKLSHIPKRLVFVAIQISIFFFLFGQFINNKSLYTSFGFSSQPTLIGMVLFGQVFGPLGNVIGLMGNFLSRKFEYEADEFAAKMTDKLGPALIKIHAENASNLVPDKLYSTLNFSHPTLIERLDAIDAHLAKRK